MTGIQHFHERLFDSEEVKNVYMFSRVMQEIPAKCLDSVMPAIQIAAGKEPAHLNRTRVQKLDCFLRAGIGFVGLIVTSPLFASAKLIQWILASNMHDHVVTQALKTSFPHSIDQGIKVASCNVIGLINPAFLLRDKPNGEVAVKRLPKIVKAFEKDNIDILCLQECFDFEATDKMVAALHSQFNYVVSHVGDNSAVHLGSGLVIASKYPILDVRFVAFKNRAGIDKFAHKGVVFIKLDLGENDKKKQIGYVANTHLQANASKKGNSALGPEMRVL